MGALALGVAVLAGTAPVWVRAATSSAVDERVARTASGTEMAPGAGAGALVVLAAACALVLGGPWGRRLAALGIVLGGVLVVASSVGAALSPTGAVRAAAREAVGVAVLTEPARLTAWPWVVAGLGAACAALGVTALLAAGRWGRAGTRHEVPPSSARPGAADAEPTSRPTSRPAAPAGADAEVDGHDAWDSLSRGQDPT